MLILISDAFDKSLPEKLSAFGEVTDDKSRLGEAEVVLIRSKTKADKAYIDQAPRLRLIIRGGVGMDNIDKEYCKEKGIIALNTPKSSAPAVAELAFALMLSVPNHIPYYDSTMKKGESLTCPSLEWFISHTTDSERRAKMTPPVVCRILS